MDGEFNETYITFGGHVDIEKNRYLYFCIIFVAYILIILFNSTIVCLIWIHRNLHEPMYIFIAALLINSVLFSTNIYPKLLIDFLSEKQITSFPTCLLQFFIVYCLASAEFLLLSAMAYDRYVSICKPLQYPTIMSKNTVCIILGLVWLLPCCHTVVPVVLTAPTKRCKSTLNGILCNNTMYGLYCVRPRAQYIFGSIFLVIAALCPILFILFTYTRIFLITYRGNKEVRKKAAETCLPHLLVLISFSCLCAYDVIIVRLGSNFSKTARFIMTLQIILYHPLFNPIIYGLKMKEISKHLKRLFCQTKAM